MEDCREDMVKGDVGGALGLELEPVPALGAKMSSDGSTGAGGGFPPSSVTARSQDVPNPFHPRPRTSPASVESSPSPSGSASPQSHPHPTAHGNSAHSHGHSARFAPYPSQTIHAHHHHSYTQGVSGSRRDREGHASTRYSSASAGTSPRFLTPSTSPVIGGFRTLSLAHPQSLPHSQNQSYANSRETSRPASPNQHGHGMGPPAPLFKRSASGDMLCRMRAPVTASRTCSTVLRKVIRFRAALESGLVWEWAEEARSRFRQIGRCLLLFPRLEVGREKGRG